MRTFRGILASVVLLALIPVVARSSGTGSVVRAGVGIADATWHVGTGSGQYADKDPNASHLVTGGEVDPFNHGLTQEHSYGVQSRLTYRALVVEGSNGKKIALVKSDSYLAQDYLVRRAAQILAEKGSSIGYDQIMLTASHNHSSPYYMSPSWGVWLFQDAFEIRTFEYHARQFAAAVMMAEKNMHPARMGATTVRHTIYKGMIAGATITDDGSPGGYPETVHTCSTPNPNECVGKSGSVDQDAPDFNVTVMRLDDMTDPQNPKPLGVWVNHGEHPESNDGYALITADFLAPLERDVERATGAPLIFSQADVGSSEGPYWRGNNETLPDGVIRAWAHVGHAQTERGARYLADSIVKAYNDIGSGLAKVPFSSDFVVDYKSIMLPEPLSHPYPSVSNCRTETTAEGSPGSPILGLPDCERATGADPNNMLWETLKTEGIPVPDHYDAPSHGAVEENYRLRLQAFRVGEVVIASCACEAQTDIVRNFESRADNVTGNIWDGFDWGIYCTQNGDTTWTCPRPGVNDLANPSATIKISDARYRLMEAQVHNDAKGWDLPSNIVAAESEPGDTTKIFGNFTKVELPSSQGYAIAVGVGHAGDYNGYTVSYREYMSRDHYRKALTCCGPHTADYMSTNMVRLAGSLHGGPAYTMVADPNKLDDGSALEEARLEAFVAADEARQQSIATALGILSAKTYDAWVASLPNDAGTAHILTQPADVTRFQAATFSWQGGSNATDNPVPHVERLVDGDWQPFADQTGEVQTKVEFPVGAQQVADVYAGNFAWKWSANFEAFDAFPKNVIPGGQIPDGTYRFVVDGNIHQAGAVTGEVTPYHLASDSFDVGPWQGITGANTAVTNGDVSLTVNDTYPRTYTSPWRFVHDDGDARLCKTCSFRPWAPSGTVEKVTVTVTRADSTIELVSATLSGGVWTADTNLQPGDSASIAPGGIVDSFGEINGSAINF